MRSKKSKSKMGLQAQSENTARRPARGKGSLVRIVLLCASLSLILFYQPVVDFFSTVNLEGIAVAQAARSFTVYTVQESSYAGHPHAAIDDNGYIYVTYEDYWDADGDGSSEYTIDFQKSTDNAGTFSRTNVAYSDSAENWYPRIAVNNIEDAYVIFTRVTSGNYYASAYKSTHPGGVYSFSAKLDSYDDVVANTVTMHDVAVENVMGVDNVVGVVERNIFEGTEKTFNVYSAYSTNEGANWYGTVAQDNIGTDRVRYPAVAVKKTGETDIYAAWVNVDSQTIQFDYSVDRGENWQMSPDGTVTGNGVPEEQRPGIAAIKDVVEGKSWVFVVWTASVPGAGGVKNIYFNYTLSPGYSSWQTYKQLGNVTNYGAYDQDQVSVAAEIYTTTGYPHLYAAWRDSRDNYVYFQEATWDSQFHWGIDTDGDGEVESSEEGIDMRVSTSASGSEENPTVLAGTNGEVYVVWRDTGGYIKAARYGKYPSSSYPGAPSAPTGVSATAGSGSVTLDWNDNSEGDLSYYTVYRGTTRGTYSSLGTTTVSAYTDGSVTNGTVYWYVVTAYDTDGNQSGYSIDVRATPQASGGDEIPPSKPTGLTATPGDTEVGLDWSENSESDLSVYHVYRATIVGANNYSYVTETSSSTTTYVDTGLTNGTTYYYVVTAIDTNNNESDDSLPASATPSSGSEIAGGAPSAPTNLTATGGNGFVSLDWSDNSEADLSNYKLYRGTSRGSYTVYVSSVAASLYTDNGVANGTLYWYVVSAVDTDSNESGYSNEAQATPNTTDTTKPNAPTNLTATGSEDRISLSWTASTSSDISSYHIYRSATSAGAYYHLSYSSSTTYDDTNLTLGTTRYYVVTAVDTSNNESSDSNEASATVSVSSPEAAPDSEGGEAGGPGGGCFIATACYGSPLSPEVEILSEFRDKFLLTNTPGKLFVRTYYAVSPSVASHVRENHYLKSICRSSIRPAIAVAKRFVRPGED